MVAREIAAVFCLVSVRRISFPPRCALVFEKIGRITDGRILGTTLDTQRTRETFIEQTIDGLSKRILDYMCFSAGTMNNSEWYANLI